MKISTLAKLTEQSERHLHYIKKGDRKPSPQLAKQLEHRTGVSRLKWLYPKEYGDPWTEIELSVHDNNS